ncbi:hypothetical protein [Pseudonocardia humida]|uniref:Roadblock/LAMTOR2 domain-containing protein n=1 Tax=Pseudonocardia humida TaxID=2800819 RepID=A0ABT1A6L7_9PSEU|nr:hypothetical protein [Pseudonocardia humida]MCO1658663.1 hypothetical protein [Pseudonocardia humida]
MITTDALLRQVGRLDGVLAACVVDPSTGTVVGATQQRAEVAVPVVAAGAADVVHVLGLMTAGLALGGEVEDVVVTATAHFHILRVLPVGPDQGLVLMVTLERARTNLAMAHREIRAAAAP